MVMIMDYPNIDERAKRGEYIENWYQIEKSAERIAGVLLLFASGLIVALDQPGDQWSLYAIVGCIAGGITLLAMSRKPHSARIALNFLRAQAQTTRATFAGMGAMILITQMGTRPLAIIVGGLLLIVAMWFQWRAYKIKQFDQLFNPEQAERESQGDEQA